MDRDTETDRVVLSSDHSESQGRMGTDGYFMDSGEQHEYLMFNTKQTPDNETGLAGEG